jgi:hypothetical protein
MKKALILPDTIQACHEIIISQARLIEQLQRRAFGGSLKDRAVKYEGPSLFDEYNEEAQLEANAKLEKVSGEIDKETNKRREEAKCLSLKKVDSLNLKQWVVTFFKGKSI